MNSVPPYVRKLHFMYEAIRTSGKCRWNIYRTSSKCRWSIYRTSRKRRGTLRIVHKVERSSPTVYLVFYNPSPPRMLLSLDLLSEYWIQQGAIGPLYVTSSYSTWIFCRGVSGFATDCPWNVWCSGLTPCLLHVGPPLGNRFLNTSWAVGLTYWIVYLHFYLFRHLQLYMSWYIISLFGFVFTS